MKIAIEADIDFIAKLKDGNEEVLNAVYKDNERAFIQWAQYHFNVDYDQAKDVFQLSIIALYHNAKIERLQTLSSSLKTYLFSIGRRLLLKLKKKEINNQTFNYEDLASLEIPDEVYANLVDNNKLTRILSKIGEPCNTILQKFYFYGLTMEQLAVETGYKTEGVVRKKKHECMQKLKKLIAVNNLRVEDFLI